MAITACARCQNQSFELQEAKIRSINHHILFVQCTSCGTPAGVVENQMLTLLQEQDARLKNLEQHIGSIASAVSHIGRIVGALANQHTV